MEDVVRHSLKQIRIGTGTSYQVLPNCKGRMRGQSHAVSSSVRLEEALQIPAFLRLDPPTSESDEAGALCLVQRLDRRPPPRLFCRLVCAGRAEQTRPPSPKKELAFLSFSAEAAASEPLIAATVP